MDSTTFPERNKVGGGLSKLGIIGGALSKFSVDLSVIYHKGWGGLT